MSVSLNWCPLVRALVDCGADVNVVSAEYYNGMMNKVRTWPGQSRRQTLDRQW